MQAKYPLVKYTDMTAEVREEALDICITAVEKYATDMEKCTQVCVTWGEGHARALMPQPALDMHAPREDVGWLLRGCHTHSGSVLSVLLLSVADDQGSDGQEVWVALARHRGQGVCVRD